MDDIKIVSMEHIDGNVCVGVKTIPNTLDAVQSIVGGMVESCDIFPKVARKGIKVLVNEEGIRLELPPTFAINNRKTQEIVDIVLGNVIFTSHNNKGNFISLTDRQISFLIGYLDDNDGFAELRGEGLEGGMLQIPSYGI